MQGPSTSSSEEAGLVCKDVGALAAKAKDEKKGIPVKDHRYGFRKYPKSFLGTEVVDWVYQNVRGMDSRFDALKIAQELMDEGLFLPVSTRRRGQPFRDAAVLYRFSSDFVSGECGDEEDDHDLLGEKTKISSDELDDLLPIFKDPKQGVEVKDRRKILRTYHQCFVGSEAVDWLCDRYNISRSAAVELGQKMANMGFFEHVKDPEKGFDDADMWYRFVDPEMAGPSISESTTMYDFSAMDIDKKLVKLDAYTGQLVDAHGSKGFTILGFPCNQFGKQEPGTNDEIKEFVKQYKVSFPLFDKINVNGPKAHPLFKWLKNKLPGTLGTKGVKWNFTKFLINKKGIPVNRYGPPTEPKDIEEDILKLLAE